MFKKLVTNIPFQPALVDQVVFYSHRLHQEESLRRLGVLLMTMVFVLQIFTLIFPTKPSLATSANDLVYGASSKEQILQAYTTNRDSHGRNDIKAIYNHYGIGIEQIQAAKPQRIGSLQKNYISTGRGTSPGIDKFIPIVGVNDGGIYERPLSNWDMISHRENWYDTITGMSSFGFRFWLIIDGCGNIVFEQNSLPPNINIIKQRTSGASVNVNDAVGYLIQFQNKGPGTALNVNITDTIPSGLSYVSHTSNTDVIFSKSGQTLNWRINNNGSSLPASQRWYIINLNLKATTSTSSSICNTTNIAATGFALVSSGIADSDACVTIITPTCPGTGLPIPMGGVENCQITCPDGSRVPYNKSCTIPQLACVSLKILESPTWDSRKLETKIISQKGAIAKNLTYYINNKKVSVVPVDRNANTQIFTYKFATSGTYSIKATLSASAGSVQPSQSCQVQTIVNKPSTPQPRISTDKAVSNITQRITDANNSTAQVGDKLKYTIFVSNSGDAPAVNLMLDGDMGESINDILEYSNLIDKGDAKFNEQTKYLSWGAVTIPAHSKIQKSFTVQVKNPLPNTPTSASDPLSYDFNMQNKYGRMVIVHLNKPVTKVLEQTATTLPNTGPGSSMVILFILTMLIGYFFYRSKLLVKELDIIQYNYSTGGI